MDVLVEEIKNYVEAQDKNKIENGFTYFSPLSMIFIRIHMMSNNSVICTIMRRAVLRPAASDVVTYVAALRNFFQVARQLVPNFCQ